MAESLPSAPRECASPSKCVTYSVSFCDSFLDQDNDAVLDTCNDDLEKLISEKKNTRCNFSRPERSPRSLSESGSSSAITPKYGGVSNSEAGLESPTTNVQRLIFCVHGHPQGGCVISNGRCGSIGKAENGIEEAILPNSEIPAELGHCHQERTNLIDLQARRKLILASILCVVFMIAEIVGGILSGSLAIATDAAHLLTDFASFMISLFSLWVAARPPSRTMSFGWYRAEVIGALTSVLMIWVVTGVLVYLAVERVVEKDFKINATVMLITSAVGVAVNLVMGLTLHQHGHSHGSSHSHGGGHSHSGSTSHHHEPNINVRAAFIHVLGDFIQSFGVFVASLIIYFKPEWIIVDPICTFLFSVLVLVTTFAIVRDALLVLMEGMPKGIDFSKVLSTLMNIDGVVRVHNLRIWALSLDKTALSAHLAIRPDMSPQAVLATASHEIRKCYDFFELTLQIEEFREEMEDCNQCQCPEG